MSDNSNKSLLTEHDFSKFTGKSSPVRPPLPSEGYWKRSIKKPKVIIPVAVLGVIILSVVIAYLYLYNPFAKRVTHVELTLPDFSTTNTK